MCHALVIPVDRPEPDDEGGMQGEVDRLRRREAQLEREIERLKSYFGKIKSLLVPVLCDPEGYVCIHGSYTDKEEIQKAKEHREKG